MLFKFPKKKIVLDCFTDNEIILQTAPIMSAMKHIPDWWKKLPNSIPHPNGFSLAPTMKNCVGMIDYYKHSVAIPMWTDLQIKVEGQDYSWQFSDSISSGQIHETQQSAGLLPNHGHLKIMSPWFLKTKEDINWVWSQPTFSLTEEITNLKILPGLLNFYLQNRTHINILLPLNESKLYTINQGQVLAHITPMSDKKIEVVRHLVSSTELNLMAQQRISFLNAYKTVIKQKQKFAGCPYHKENV